MNQKYSHRNFNKIPLCVDLDHTLIKTDLLFEHILAMAKKNLWELILILPMLFINRAKFKQYLVDLVELDVDTVPVRDEVVKYLQNAFTNGTDIVLVTGSHKALADKIIKRYPFFREAMATTEDLNLVGPNKAKILVQRFGRKGFDYIGDSSTDLPVWAVARESFYVGNSKRLIKKIDNLKKTFPITSSIFRDSIAMLRPQQWVKNLLVFAPMVFAHIFHDPSKIIAGIWSFISFSLIASSVYIFNDLVDLPYDRRHPKKCKRPLAAGKLSVPWAVCLIFVLLAMGFLVGLNLPNSFILYCIIYLAFNFSYTLSLKQYPLIDVFVLATFYVVRLFAGGAATDVIISDWLKIFSMFIFMSLGFLKRYSERLRVQGLNKHESFGRGYSDQDLTVLLCFGISSGFLSCLTLGLYLFLTTSQQIYSHPQVLWVITVLMLYWISSLWMRASKDQVDDDPVSFALKDRTSQVLMLMILLLFVAAT